MRSPVCLAVLLLLAPHGLSQGYNYYEGDNYYYEYDVGEEEADLPNFLARPQTFTVEVGQSVIIPCDVENLGTSKLIFKKIPASGGREKLLAVGSERVTRDRRFSVAGSRLTISHARPRDAGTFLCMLEMEPPIQLRHTLDVQFAPTIRSLAPPEQHVAKGTTVTLECRTQGNPQPVIRWSRQEGPLPSGLRSKQGHRLTLEGVDRHVEGTYLCTADNGIGEPASAATSLTVEYPPEITTEKPVVRSGEGDNVELVCVVSGRPSPDVTWTRDGHPLPDTDMDTKLYLPGRRQNGSHAHYDSYDAHLSLAHAAHRHILTINNVSEKDFGSYVCIAENTHGHKEALIQMTGLPQTPGVTSSPLGREGTRYTLAWATDSYYPITEFLIKYRKTHLGGWQANNRTMMMAGTWKNISKNVTTESIQEHDTRYSMAFTLEGLEVAGDYVAVIRVRNKYGWSAESPHFTFVTRKGTYQVLESTSGATGRWTDSFTSCPFLLVLLLFTTV